MLESHLSSVHAISFLQDGGWSHFWEETYQRNIGEIAKVSIAAVSLMVLTDTHHFSPLFILVSLIFSKHFVWSRWPSLWGDPDPHPWGVWALVSKPLSVHFCCSCPLRVATGHGSTRTWPRGSSEPQTHSSCPILSTHHEQGQLPLPVW